MDFFRAFVSLFDFLFLTSYSHFCFCRLLWGGGKGFWTIISLNDDKRWIFHFSLSDHISCAFGCRVFYFRSFGPFFFSKVSVPYAHWADVPILWHAEVFSPVAQLPFCPGFQIQRLSFCPDTCHCFGLCRTFLGERLSCGIPDGQPPKSHHRVYAVGSFLVDIQKSDWRLIFQ